MIFIIPFLTLLALLYAAMVFRMHFMLKSASDQVVPQQGLFPEVSIVVAYRNEEKHLQNLLSDIRDQDYPVSSIEIILVNDHSTDQSKKVVDTILQDYPLAVKHLDLDGAQGKKAAIGLGIKSASSDLVLQTDADCRLPRGWIRNMTRFMGEEVMMVVGPVEMLPAAGLWSRFAALEYLSLQSVTAASILEGNPLMASGANLLYRKSLWSSQSVQEEKVSGDDTFLVQRSSKQGLIRFALCRDAQVSTGAVSSLSELLNQRARWGGKSISYPDGRARLIAAFIALYSISILCFFILTLMNTAFLAGACVLLMIKALCDYPLLKRYARIMSQERLLRIYLIAELLYPLYIGLTGLKMLSGTSEWKGREFNPVSG